MYIEYFQSKPTTNFRLSIYLISHHIGTLFHSEIISFAMFGANSYTVGGQTIPENDFVGGGENEHRGKMAGHVFNVFPEDDPEVKRRKLGKINLLDFKIGTKYFKFCV